MEVSVLGWPPHDRSFVEGLPPDSSHVDMDTIENRLSARQAASLNCEQLHDNNFLSDSRGSFKFILMSQ